MTDEERVLAAIRASEAQVDEYAASLRGRGFDSFVGSHFEMVNEMAGQKKRKKQSTQPGVEWLIPALLVVAAGAILLSR